MKKYIFLIFISFSLKEIKSQSLMTVKEIYDYNVGDIYITRTSFNGAIRVYEKKIIKDKYFNLAADTVFYIYDSYGYMLPTCQACTATYDTTRSKTLYYTHLNDTLGADIGSKIHYWSWDCVDTAGYTGVWVDTVYNDSTLCNKYSVVISRMDNGFIVDSCYKYFEGFFGYDKYGRGVGQTEHYYNTSAIGQSNGGGVLLCTLLFYKKGSDSCGIAPIIPLPTGINELKFSNSFKISPNPFSIETQFSFSEIQTNSVITITNILGEEMVKLNFSGQQLTLERGKLKSGIYFVQLNNKKNIYSAKLIVQ
ncbi:MAG TPA: T9SS type A sorting domain-containing protein [Bacteroidia bacterium]|nr:T9SS type A sorting domain-containing protein [Bacteroidia bacterium]